jgi:acyl dehydratase
LAENSFNPYQEFPKTTVLEIEEVTFKKPVKAGKAFRIEAEVLGGGPFRIMGIGACGNSSLSDTTV